MLVHEDDDSDDDDDAGAFGLIASKKEKRKGAAQPFFTGNTRALAKAGRTPFASPVCAAARTLKTPQGNPGSRYRCGRST